MSTGIRNHLRSNIIGYVGVFFALTATAYGGSLAPDNSVDSAAIINGEVRSKDIKGDAVTGQKLAEDTLDPNILQRRVSGSCPEGEAIRIVAAGGTVTCEALTSATTPTGPAGGDLTGAYPNPAIAVGAIEGPELDPSSVTAAKLAPDAVSSSSKIAEQAILSSDISDISGGTIQDQDIGTNQITAAELGTVTVQRTTVALPTSNVRVGATATCPAGAQALAGDAEADNGTVRLNHPGGANDNLPSGSSFNSWGAIADVDSTSVAGTLRVWVVCLSGIAG